MKKIDNIHNLSSSKKFIKDNPHKSEQFMKCLSTFDPNWSRSIAISQLKIVIKIAENNDTFYNLYDDYKSCNSTKRKIEITQGTDRLKQYEETLKRRPKPVTVSVLNTKYWTRGGLSECEAVLKISKLQSERSNKRTSESKALTNKNSKLRLEFWMNQGYSKEQSELLREPYLKLCKNDLDSMIARHGEVLGANKYATRVDKYRTSMRENLPTRKGVGYVSKESKKFFVPIYKFCRRLGISKDDICVGITGSREFFIKDTSFPYNCGKFYDFTIKSLKLIVEYHGTYWHPRNIDEWRNPSDFYTAVDADRYKENLAINFNMMYNIVWSDEDKAQATTRITNLIEELYNA